MTESAITVRDLRIGYSHGRRGSPVDVVHGVSFDVHRGQTTALVGQSGSGKSTIAHGISGLLPANGAVTGGRVHLLGRDVTRLRPRQWRDLYGSTIGFVPQDPLSSLDPLVRVGNQIAQSLRVHRTVARDRIRSTASWSCSTASASPTRRNARGPTRTSSPVASCNGCSSRSRSPRGRRFSSPTSRPRRWT